MRGGRANKSAQSLWFWGKKHIFACGAACAWDFPEFPEVPDLPALPDLPDSPALPAFSPAPTLNKRMFGLGEGEGDVAVDDGE